MALWQPKFPSFLLLPFQDVLCFCEGLAHVHCPTITDVTHVFPLLANKIAQRNNLGVYEGLAATAEVVLSLAQSWKFDILSLLYFAFISLFPKDIEFVKQMLDK